MAGEQGRALSAGHPDVVCLPSWVSRRLVGLVLMTPAEFAAWTSAAIAAVALVAVVVFGLLNLRQARRGPDGSPRWALEPGPRGRVDLVNVGSAEAFDVHIKVDDAVGADGKTQFKVFSAGQRASFIVASGIGSPEPKVQVEYADRRGRRNSWVSDIPGHR